MRNISEFELIDRISSGCLIRKDAVIKGIGDDAAVFSIDKDNVLLVTTDSLVEHVHFMRQGVPPFHLGYKALAVNLSDIAAMGGTAREAFVNIAMPDTCPVAYIDGLYKGIKSIAAEFDVNILGGDTTRSKTDIFISITVIGIAQADKVLYRSAARPGDGIFSTGFLGDSRAGLYVITNHTLCGAESFKELVHAHLHPKPFLREGRFLAGQAGVHAAIDVSDGLSSDLGHIIQESHVGARLYAESLPVSEPLKRFCDRYDVDPVEYALSGGEDYTLLFTVSGDVAGRVAQAYQKEFGVPVYRIGEITDLGKMELVDKNNTVRTITPSGWDHFKRKHVL